MTYLRYLLFSYTSTHSRSRSNAILSLSTSDSPTSWERVARLAIDESFSIYSRFQNFCVVPMIFSSFLINLLSTSIYNVCD
ncbi:hypothetical protein L2E82_46362 [Cichorium intybus]|uniref:Uncharacterized protein n=1 Tax=Cichorium intybus TaxID=13427 RepID=A0ACB8YTR9_CICIN|nr:hypothetical protein L2E82_46362 [Cichorium intybus]